MNDKNIQSLQMLRAVAACSVVFSHIFGGKFPVLGSGGILGVDLFFVLSGFLMMLTYKEDVKGKDFLVSRIKRIYPAYIIISIPMFILSYSSWNENLKYDLVHNLILTPTFGGNYDRANEVCWTLTYEMYFYLIMSLAMFFVKGKLKVLMLTSGIMLSIFILNGGLRDGTSGWADNSIHNLVSNYLIIDFMIGGILGAFYNSRKFTSSYKPLFFCAVFFLITSYNLTQNLPSATGDKYQIFTFLFSGIPATIIVYILSRTTLDNHWIFKFLVYIGTASYSIYLSHLYVRMAFDAYVKKSIVDRPLSFIIAILLGCIVYELIEKRLNFKFRGKRLPKLVG